MAEEGIYPLNLPNSGLLMRSSCRHVGKFGLVRLTATLYREDRKPLSNGVGLDWERETVPSQTSDMGK